MYGAMSFVIAAGNYFQEDFKGWGWENFPKEW